MQAIVAQCKDWIAQHQLRVLLVILGFWLAATAIDIGEPVDDAMRSMRNKIRAAETSSDIAIVFPDSKIYGGYDQWTWSDAEMAQLAASIRKSGAKRIVLSQETPEGARLDLLAAELSKFPERSVIGVVYETSPFGGERKLKLPNSALLQNADIAYINSRFNSFGGVLRGEYASEIEGRIIPSLSAAAARKSGPDTSPFQIDYASARQLAAPVRIQELVLGKSDLTGKTVFVASAKQEMNLARYLRVPLAYANFYAANTLMRGKPGDLGIWSAFVVSALFSLFVWVGNRNTGILASAAGLAILVGAPILLEHYLVFADSFTGLMALISVVMYKSWLSFKQSTITKNALTGLPNLNALKQAKGNVAKTLIVCRIANFRSLAAVITDHDTQLMRDICARLELAAHSKLYHNEDGVFAWLSDNENLAEVTDELDALHLLFIKPFAIGRWTVDVPVTFGIELQTNEKMKDRLPRAMMAAEKARKLEKKWHCFGTEELNATETEFSLLHEMGTALANGEIWVAYQPKYHVADGKLYGFEALVRWSHPTNGVIPPDQFIPIAESNDRIDELTFFVLDQALGTLTTVSRIQPDIVMSVNLSTRNLSNAELPTRIKQMLAQHHVPASQLILEITETAKLSDTDRAFEILAELRDFGIRLSIDDYGTGYSSLEYIKMLQASEIKLDRTFVSRMDEQTTDQKLVKATIDLARSLGISVVAEGVESETQLQMLADFKCDLAQGYHLCRPVPAAELAQLIATAQEIKAA
jgi:diguanylate cyclase